MKILITGATGFVGRNLCERLAPLHEIHILTRRGSDSSKLPHAHEYVFAGDTDDLARYMRAENIDGVVHLAAMYVAEHRGEQIKDLILSNIYFGTAVLDAAARAEVKWFLNTGTIW